MTLPDNGAPRTESGARRPARLSAFTAVAVGFALVAGAAFAACGSEPPPDAGAVPASASASPPATAPQSPSASPRVAVSAGALPAMADPVPPTRLRIPALGVNATVNPVAVNPATNQFEVPPSVDQVGWYRFGPGLEATAGSVVIAGHVDGAKQGAGAFFRLRDLAIGATVEVAGADGRTRTFRAVARETYPKSSIPLDRYFVRDGTPRLTLITCGGPFNRQTRSYRDNVVITAELAT